MQLRCLSSQDEETVSFSMLDGCVLSKEVGLSAFLLTANTCDLDFPTANFFILVQWLHVSK